MSEPKIEQIKRILDSEEGRALTEYIKSRRRSRSDMDLKRVVRVLRERGHNVTLQDVLRDFRGFETLGLGRLLYDKKRFTWDYNFVSLGKALEEQGELKARRIPQAHLSLVANSAEESNGGQHIVIRKDDYEIVVPLDIDDAGIVKLNHILERLKL